MTTATTGETGAMGTAGTTTTTLQNLAPQEATKRQSFSEVFGKFNLTYTLETNNENKITLLICSGTQSQSIANSALHENVSFTFNYLQFAQDSEPDFSESALLPSVHTHVKEIFALIVAKVASGASIINE